MTNDPMTKEARIPNDEVAETAIVFVLRASSFFRHWVFRHSSFPWRVLAQALH
jgi:hypothetical protein